MDKDGSQLDSDMQPLYTQENQSKLKEDDNMLIKYKIKTIQSVKDNQDKTLVSTEKISREKLISNHSSNKDNDSRAGMMYNPKLNEEPSMESQIEEANEVMMKELEIYNTLQSGRSSLPVVNVS